MRLSLPTASTTLKPPYPSGVWAGPLLLLAFALPRFLLWAYTRGASFDIQSYMLVEGSLHAGQGLYANPELQQNYPYLPAWAMLLQLLGRLGRAMAWAPWYIFKFPILLADLGVMACLWRLGQRYSPSLAWRAAWVWALSPVAVVIGAGHGQFDALVLLPLLLAVLALEQEKGPQSFLAGFFFGAALAFKPWPIFLLPILIRRPGLRLLRFGSAAMLLPVALSLPFVLSEGLKPLLQHLAYGGAVGLSLPQALLDLGRLALPMERSVQPLMAWRWVAWGILVLYWLRAWSLPKVRPLVPALRQALLLLLVMAPALSAQYLLWPLPFLALGRARWAWAYSAAAGILLLVYYWGHFPGVLGPAWQPSSWGWHLQGTTLTLWILVNVLFWVFLLRLLKEDAEV